jgi:hypothetical protein
LLIIIITINVHRKVIININKYVAK